MTPFIGLEDKTVITEMWNKNPAFLKENIILIYSNMPKMCIYATTLIACTHF